MVWEEYFKFIKVDGYYDGKGEWQNVPEGYDTYMLESTAYKEKGLVMLTSIEFRQKQTAEVLP